MFSPLIQEIIAELLANTTVKVQPNIKSLVFFCNSLHYHRCLTLNVCSQILCLYFILINLSFIAVTVFIVYICFYILFICLCISLYVIYISISLSFPKYNIMYALFCILLFWLTYTSWKLIHLIEFHTTEISDLSLILMNWDINVIS